ncbi:hypothetical protein ACFWP2_32435 [Kitasatospora sp. NPDC058444]|uniref:hypothetical protein n=1 Tax=Kitasatospora sp. NPDC058444 TaxID=3346504 RepID=UPI00365DA2C2
MSQEQQQFISVPVPSQHVTQVYALLAELAGTTAGASKEGVSGPLEDGEWPFVEWSVQDLRRLTEDQLDSVQVVTRVLDILAKQPGGRVSYTSLVEALDVDRKRLRGVLSAFTRVVHKHYGRRNWPMTWVEALSDGAEFKSEFFYTVNETIAMRWQEVRAQG